MESSGIILVGVWAFAIISLIGGIFGALDGFWIIIFFIVAVGVSFAVIATNEKTAATHQ